jgi:hypothetical protein
MDILRLLNTPRRQPLPSEIPETPEHLRQPQVPPRQPTPRRTPSLSPLSPRYQNASTTRDIRLQIKAALIFKVPYKDICEQFGVTERQIRWARRFPVTPQKHKCSTKLGLKTPERNILDQWLMDSPSHRRVAIHKIPRNLPTLYVGEKAIRTALKTLDYTRKRSPKKGFSENP